MLTYLIEVLPNSTHLELARLAKIRSLQVTLARTIMGATATITGTIAIAPIPLADIIPITTAQVGMIIGIAYISGRELSQKSAMEFLSALGINVGAGMVLREAARALVKYVFPGGGLFVSGIVATAGTIALGEAAIRYFIEGKSIEEAKETFSLVKAKQLEKQ